MPMKPLEYYARSITRELDQTVSGIGSDAADELIRRILGAGKIFVAGAGRSGLMARAFAMRLMHTGLAVYVVGESVTPALTSGDLLIIASGSGETGSLAAMAARAKSLGAGLAAVTVVPGSTIGRLADVVVHVPAAVKEAAAEGSGAPLTTVQPMGSLFEQSLLLFFDALVLKLMEERELPASAMFSRHANLE